MDAPTNPPRHIHVAYELASDVWERQSKYVELDGRTYIVAFERARAYFLAKAHLILAVSVGPAPRD